MKKYNRENYSWNIVYNFVMQIKDDYVKKFNRIDYEEETVVNSQTGGIKKITCLEKWAIALKNEDYINRLYPLEINQNGSFILLRYGNYASTKEGEKEIIDVFNEDFFNVYDGFYKECRSIVIDIEEEKIVLCPFKKFRNLNECEETSLDNIKVKIASALQVEIAEKIDGSMQTANYYKDKIVMAGAQAIKPENSWRLQDGIRMITSNENYCKMIQENPNWTFIFEYVSLKDAHVVKYTKEQEGMYLIGIRHNLTGEQFSYNLITHIAQLYSIDKVTQIYNQTLEDVLSETDKYTSDQREGVVLFIDGFQVKIKYDDYVKIHRVLSIVSSVNLIIQHVADGTYDDLISKIPTAYRERVSKIKDLIVGYINSMDAEVKKYFQEANKNSTNKKEFMLWVEKNVPTQYKAYVRNIYLGKEFNYIKNQLGSDTPHYKNLNEMGLQEQYLQLGLERNYECF